MAVLLDRTNPDVLTLPFTEAPPFFFACWVRTDSLANAAVPVWIGDSSAAQEDLSVFAPHTPPVDEFWLTSRLAAAGQSITTPYPALGNWVHIVGALDAEYGIALWLDGVQYLASTPLFRGTFGLPDLFALGRRNHSTPNEPFTGAIERPAIWSGAPSAWVIAQLAAGKSPDRIRPTDLLVLCVDGTGTLHDEISDADMTVASGSPTITTGPPQLEALGQDELVEPAAETITLIDSDTSQAASTSTSVSVSAQIGDVIVATTHSRGGTAVAISSLSSDLDGAFTIADERVLDSLSNQSVGIAYLPVLTTGTHVVTFSASGSPTNVALSARVYRGVRQSNPVVDSRTAQLISVTSGEDALCWSGGYEGCLTVFGASCSESTTDGVVASGGDGTESYELNWTATNGDAWGSDFIGDLAIPLLGVEHPETTVRAYVQAQLTLAPEQDTTVVFEGSGSMTLLGVEAASSGAPVSSPVVESASGHASGNNPTVSYTSGSHTVGSGEALVVAILMRGGTPSIDSVTWSLGGGEALTPVASTALDSDGLLCQFFYIAAPTSGSGTITVNFTGTPARAVIGAWSISGHDAGDFVDAGASDVDNAPDTGPEASVTTTEDATLVLAAHYTKEDTAHSGHTGTLDWTAEPSGENYASGQSIAAASAGAIELGCTSGPQDTGTVILAINGG